jgi:hypothetical protein
MSVFRVKLNNASQGLLDTDINGVQNETSIQRTIYVTGPNRINRKLVDGEEFTDCNYWKRFTEDEMGAESAFIEVVTDDGSVYSDNPGENTYPYVWTITADNGTTYEDNQIDIIGDTGSNTQFCQITNQNETDGDDVKIRLNGSTTAIFDLKAGATQIFNVGELSLTLIEVDNSGTNDVDVQVIASITGSCNS